MNAKKATKRRTAATKGKAARITAVANQKGGVGKTTTAHALIAGLTGMGFKALAVDIDPQSNLTFTFNPAKLTPNMYGLLTAASAQKDTAETALKAIQHTKQGDILPSNLMLAGADLEFNRTGREYLLTEIIDPLRSLYDYIVIDTPPALGILTITALTAADDMVIPLGADAYSIQGFEQLQATIATIKKRCNPQLKVAGLLVTRHNGRTNLAQGLKMDIDQKAVQVGTRVYKTIIRESVEVKEAQLDQRSLFNKKSNTAVADYLNFVTEYIKGAK